MYDLLLLTFNEEASLSQDKLNLKKIIVKPMNKNGADAQKHYCDIWPFINNCYGVLYKLFTTEPLGAFECCDEIFDFDFSSNVDFSLQTHFGLQKNINVNDCIKIKLNETYREDFVSVLDSFLLHSPISTVAFLCRGQSFDEEIILGAFSRDTFVEMLCEGNIRTNLCYIIERGAQ